MNKYFLKIKKKMQYISAKPSIFFKTKKIEETPFCKHFEKHEFELMPDEIAIEKYSIGKMYSPRIIGRNYTEHKNGNTLFKEMSFNDLDAFEKNVKYKTSSIDNLSELHLLHIKNAYIVKNIGIITEDSRFLYAFFNGYFNNKTAELINNALHITKEHIEKINNYPIPVVEGKCFYGSVGHAAFGHILTEFFSRLWCDELGEFEKPDYILTASQYIEAYYHLIKPFHKFRGSKILQFDGIVFCKDLYVATQSHRHYYSVSQVNFDIWRRLGQYYKDVIHKKKIYNHEKFYISRSKWSQHRGFQNEHFVENFLANQNFRIIYPEEISLPIMLSLCANSRFVATTNGSAMFHMYCALSESSFFCISPDNEFWNKWKRSLISIPSYCSIDNYLGEDIEFHSDHTRKWQVKNEADLGISLTNWINRVK